MSKVLAMDPSVELWWVPKCDLELPENEQLRIKHHHLSAREDAKINDNMIESISKGRQSKYKYAISSADLKRCEVTILDWENFDYPTTHPKLGGKPVPFVVANIGMLPQDIRTEYVDYLTGRDKDKEGDDEDLGEAT